MSMSQKVRRGTVAVAALGALALGGSALADAATKGGSTTSSSSSAQRPAAAAQLPRDPTKPGGHVGANGKTEAALPDDAAAKVRAAALAKVPGATLERVETDVDHGSPYEAHLRKGDGTELEVLVNKDFQVTAVNTMRR